MIKVKSSHPIHFSVPRGLLITLFFVNGILAIFIAVVYAIAMAFTDPPNFGVEAKRQLLNNGAFAIYCSLGYFLLAILFSAFWSKKKSWAGYGIATFSALHLIATIFLIYFIWMVSPLISLAILIPSGLIDNFVLCQVVLDLKKIV